VTQFASLFASAASWLTEFAVAFTGFAALLKLLLVRRSRWRVSLRSSRPTSLWLVKLWRVDSLGKAWQVRRTLLEGCGLRFDPALYVACRRSALTLFSLFLILLLGISRMQGVPAIVYWNSLFLAASLTGAIAGDTVWLKAFRKYRSDRIRKELVAVSSQLLYYIGSRLHLHGKLMRCLPFARIIRGDMGLLLNEWYYDPNSALRRFKERLGTDEAYGFAECIRSLHLHESDDVYDLLRELVKEYKAKIELAKESRKETSSYLMFVLAGVPILYTFQIFLYPWVQEAATLFDSLNP
jgi:hypothetical protein